MCNLGGNLRRLDLPVQAFEYWWGALQLSPVNWDILVGHFWCCEPSFEFTEEGQHAGDIHRLQESQ